MSFSSLKTGKNRRLKQAKEEAQAEIEQYRLQREKEFKAKEAAVGLPLSVFTVACRACTDWKRAASAVGGFGGWFVSGGTGE